MIAKLQRGRAVRKQGRCYTSIFDMLRQQKLLEFFLFSIILHDKLSVPLVFQTLVDNYSSPFQDKFFLIDGNG